MTNQPHEPERPAAEAVSPTDGARYRSLVESMFEGVAHCRMLFEQGQPQDFIYLEVNPAFEKLTGLKDVVGKRVTEVIPGIKESHPELFQVYGRVALTGRPEKFEIYLDALKAWLSVSVCGTEPECFTVVFENITERKQAVEALQESERRYRLLFNSLSDATFVHGELQAKESPPGFIEVNDAACQRLGYTREELLQQSPAGIDAQGRFAFSEALEKIQAREPAVWEGVHVTKDGQQFPVEISSRLLHLNGRKIFLSTARDISERNKAKLEIERLAAFPRLNPFPVLELTATGEISYLNDAAGAIARGLGLDSPAQMLPPNTAALVRECLAAGAPKLRVEARTGPRVFSWSFFPVQPTSLVHCYGGDITDLKQAETAHTRLAAIVESSDDAILSKDLDDTITSWNLGAERLFGYRAAEIIGRSFKLLVPPEGQEEEDAIMAKTRAGERVDHLETVRLTKDGRRLDVSVTNSPLKDDAGRIIGASKIMRDITERKGAGEALRESEARLRMFYEAAFAGIIISDHGIFVDVNPRLVQLLGYGASELIGRKVVDIVAPEDKALVQQHIDAGFEMPYESRLVRKDGVVIHAETQARHCLRLGRRMRVTAVYDITARRQMEEKVSRLLQQEQAILDVAPVGITLNKGRIVEWANPAHL